MSPDGPICYECSWNPEANKSYAAYLETTARTGKIGRA